MLQLATHLGALARTEEALACGLERVAADDPGDAEVRLTAALLARWSRELARDLEPLRARFGVASTKDAARARRALFRGARVADAGRLRDLEDLATLVARAGIGWLALGQAARALRDAELERLCQRGAERTRGRGAWVKEQVKQLAPLALTGPLRARRAPALAALARQQGRLLGALALTAAAGALLAWAGPRASATLRG